MLPFNMHTEKGISITYMVKHAEYFAAFYQWYNYSLLWQLMQIQRASALHCWRPSLWSNKNKAKETEIKCPTSAAVIVLQLHQPCLPSVLWRCWLGGRKGIWHVKKWDGGGGHWLVWMEWRPARWSVCLPPLIFPCTIKSRSSLLASAHTGGPEKGP